MTQEVKPNPSPLLAGWDVVFDFDTKGAAPQSLATRIETLVKKHIQFLKNNILEMKPFHIGNLHTMCDQLCTRIIMATATGARREGKEGIEKIKADSLWAQNLVKQLSTLRSFLSKNGVHGDIKEKLVTACHQRLIGEIAEIEFNKVLTQTKQACNEQIHPYLDQLRLDIKGQAPLYDWPGCTPPKDPYISQQAYDLRLLRKRLENFFPSTNHSSLWAEKQWRAGNFTVTANDAPPVPACNDQKEILRLADNLIKVAEKLGNYLIEDWHRLSENRRATPDKVAAAPGFLQRDLWKGCYLRRGLFYLPQVYHLAVNLAGKETTGPNKNLLPENWNNLFFDNNHPQYEWQSVYYKYCRQIEELTDGALERTNPYLFAWLRPHARGEVFPRFLPKEPLYIQMPAAPHRAQQL